jgi:hypothetical protein
MFDVKYLLLVIPFLCSLTGNAQDSDSLTENRMRIQLEVGYHMGGTIQADFFTYKSGYMGRLGGRKKIGEDIFLTGTLGIDQYDDLLFFPLEIGMDGIGGKSGLSFLNFRAGYSFAAVNMANSPIYHDVNGGLVLEMGWNKLFQVNPTLQIGCGIGIKQQQSTVTYEAPGSEQYNQKTGITSVQFHLNMVLF